MNNATRALAAFSAALLVGCGHLAVDVAVLDPRVVESEADRYLYRNLLAQLLAQSDASVKEKVEAIKMEHQAFYQQTAEQYCEVASTLESNNKKVVEGIADALIQDFGRVWDDRYEKWKTDLVKLANRARELSAEIDAHDAESPPIMDRIKLTAVLRQYHANLAEIQRAIRIDTNNQVYRVASNLGSATAAGSSIASAQEKLEESAEESANAVAASFGLDTKPIHDSPHAHAVASAPPSAWAKPFNRAYGRGYLGNVDVAIALDSQTGNYTVKGVLFDPSDVASAISKVTTQALVLAAQVYGVPVSPGSGDGGTPAGTALMNSSKELSDLETSTATKVAGMEDFDNALDAIAASIVEKRERLTGGDADARAEAIEAIKATFDAYKDRLTHSEE